jgi:hypothetical protein
MKIQLTMTPAEGKRLIAKAIASMEKVQKAFKDGIVIIATSTSSAYVVEELLGKELNKGMFTAGVVTSEGAGITKADGRYNHYVFEKGKLTECGTPGLVPFLVKMGPNDVFIKGVNAIDVFGNAGILLHGSGGGTIGTAWGHIVRNGISCIIPAGLEKLVPGDLSEVQNLMGANVIDKAMGWPSGLISITGDIITEIEAFEELFAVDAIPVGSGGIDGAEGCKVFLLEGDEKDALAAYEAVLKIQGEPELKTTTTKKPDNLA